MSRDRRLQNRRAARRLGLSLVEMLAALAISAALLTAVTVALNASFYAYASAAESASAQSSTRLVMQRLVQMIRTSTLHDAYDPDQSGLSLQPASGTGSNRHLVHSVGIEMIDQQDRLVRIWWEANDQYDGANVGDLMYRVESNDAQPLLERVELRDPDNAPAHIFRLVGRPSPDGWLLHRATVDLTVQPGADATLELESARGSSPDVRLVASAIPRRNIE